MKAYELLSDRSKWTQNHSARDKDNKPISPYSPDAVSWCLVGALSRCYMDDTNKYRAVRDKVLETINTPHVSFPLSTFNDTHDYNHVWNILKKADV